MKIKSIAKFQKKTTLLFIGFFCLMSCSEASNQQTLLMDNNMLIATISSSAGEIKIELDKENVNMNLQKDQQGSKYCFNFDDKKVVKLNIFYQLCLNH